MSECCLKRGDIDTSPDCMCGVGMAATVLAVLTIPLVILWRLSLTPQQNAKRLRSKGHTYRFIAKTLNASPTTARRWVLA